MPIPNHWNTLVASSYRMVRPVHRIKGGARAYVAQLSHRVSSIPLRLLDLNEILHDMFQVSSIMDPAKTVMEVAVEAV